MQMKELALDRSKGIFSTVKGAGGKEDGSRGR